MAAPSSESAPRLKRVRKEVCYTESAGSEDEKLEDNDDYESMMLRGTTTPNLRNKGKKFKWQQLVYCGKLAVGEEGSGVKPTISDVSWNRNKNLHSNFKGIDGLLACTGSFGTYLCCYSKSTKAASSAATKRNTVEDLEEGWNKIKLSEIPAKLCQWAPLNGGKYLAVGSVASDGKGRVYLYDCAGATEGLFTHVEAFVFHVSLGINSLSWDSKGVYLLVTSNSANTVVMITRSKAKNTSSQTIKCPFMKEPHPKEADLFGVFHPFRFVFFVVTSYGAVSMYKFDQESKTQALGIQWPNITNRLTDRGFCGIAINSSGHILVCPRVDGSVSCMKIDYDLVDKRHSPAIEEVYKLAPNPSVCVKWIRGTEFLATVDKKQLISIYKARGSQLLPLCDNRKDIDCYKKCNEQDAMDWRLDGLGALGGEDGLLNFWAFQSSTRSACSFAVKSRDHISEKLFYHKKPLQYGRGEVVQKDMRELADSAGAIITCLEGKVKTMTSLASEGLDKIYQGVVLTQDEVKTILEGIRESAYGE